MRWLRGGGACVALLLAAACSGSVTGPPEPTAVRSTPSAMTVKADSAKVAAAVRRMQPAPLAGGGTLSSTLHVPKLTDARVQFVECRSGFTITAGAKPDTVCNDAALRFLEVCRAGWTISLGDRPDSTYTGCVATRVPAEVRPFNSIEAMHAFPAIGIELRVASRSSAYREPDEPPNRPRTLGSLTFTNRPYELVPLRS